MRPQFLNICICLCCFLVFTQKSSAQTANSATNKAGKYYTSFDGAKIYYEVQGEGQPVILLHGFRNTMAN